MYRHEAIEKAAQELADAIAKELVNIPFRRMEKLKAWVLTHARKVIGAYRDDTLVRLVGRIDDLEEALRPFADVANSHGAGFDPWSDMENSEKIEIDTAMNNAYLTVGDFRRAKLIYSEILDGKMGPSPEPVPEPASIPHEGW